MSYKPDGYTSLAPYLIVPDPRAVLDFCAAVFDAQELRVIHDGARIMHAECRIGDTVLMMGGNPNGTGALVHIYLPDPDAAFAKALSLGAEEIQPMMEKGDGDRRGGFRTPCGTQWFVARQV
ncbi:bleomycin resistance protein [Rhodobacteraceae bacterium D3-12]|nr:bleomycin resistance protein [Rhodobacteraceae bacterium D3-12]